MRGLTFKQETAVQPKEKKEAKELEIVAQAQPFTRPASSEVSFLSASFPSFGHSTAELGFNGQCQELFFHAANCWPKARQRRHKAIGAIVRRSLREDRRFEKAIAKSVPKCHRRSMAIVLEESRKRITARVSDEVRTMLEQAAELVGATVNQFMVQSAYQEAQRLLERESLIHLSQQDSRKVFSLLENPPKPSKRLKTAVKAFKGSVRAYN